jgi:hypothetical protein
MQEQRKAYKGHSIVIRYRSGEATAVPPAAEGGEPELYIDDEPVFTVRGSAGQYIASGLAYDPQESLEDLGKRIIDARAAADE